MKNILVVCSCLLLSACLFPIIPTLKGGGSAGNSVGLFSANSKGKTVDEVKRQMLACGYPGTDPWIAYSNVMKIEEYTKANICMEQHGFRSEKNKSICHNKWFISTGGPEAEQMCQVWLKEFKR